MNEIITRICKVCGKKKKVTDFYKKKSNKDGREYYCKKCQADYNSKHEKEHSGAKKISVGKYYLKNKDRICECKKLWRIKNLDFARAYFRKNTREWFRKNPNKNAEYRHNRRAVIAGVGGIVTAKEFNELCEKYGNICLCCKKSVPLVMDHVVPLSVGGKNIIENIQPLCLPCNSSKRSKSTDYRP
jgi:5-methylcytosine-specific restriction endonuclease McrA